MMPNQYMVKSMVIMSNGDVHLRVLLELLHMHFLLTVFGFYQISKGIARYTNVLLCQTLTSKGKYPSFQSSTSHEYTFHGKYVCIPTDE
jgi:hypothetical protein